MTDWDADGMRVRRAVLGDAHVDRATAAADEFTLDFQQFITRYAWGAVWGRPGLDRHTRSVITVSVLTALRADGELEMHLRAALRNGVTPDELKEVLMHVAVYAGVPAANSAFALADSCAARGRSVADGWERRSGEQLRRPDGPD